MFQCKRIYGDILLHLAQSSSYSPRSIEGFRWNLGQNFNWIRQRMKNFPIYPHYKSRHNVAESGRFLQWMSMGKFFTRRGIWRKFCLRVRLKPSNERGEFELDWARCNKISLKISSHWDMRRTVLREIDADKTFGRRYFSRQDKG